MKKKAIEKIPYLGLKQVSRGQDVKYIGVTAVKTVGHEKHLFLEMYRNEKESMDIPVVRIALTKKDFGTYYPDKDTWTREKIGKAYILAFSLYCISCPLDGKRSSATKRTTYKMKFYRQMFLYRQLLPHKQCTCFLPRNNVALR